MSQAAEALAGSSHGLVSSAWPWRLEGCGDARRERKPLRWGIVFHACTPKAEQQEGTCQGAAVAVGATAGFCPCTHHPCATHCTRLCLTPPHRSPQPWNTSTLSAQILLSCWRKLSAYTR